jgi:hypothetical protein
MRYDVARYEKLSGSQSFLKDLIGCAQSRKRQLTPLPQPILRERVPAQAGVDPLPWTVKQ